MARKTFTAGIWILACSLGVLGYQSLTYLIYGTWPAVPVNVLWSKTIGDIPHFGGWIVDGLIGAVTSWPLVGIGIVLSYSMLLWSDVLRRRRRQS